MNAPVGSLQGGELTPDLDGEDAFCSCDDARWWSQIILHVSTDKRYFAVLCRSVTIAETLLLRIRRSRYWI
jgi:hypothetical protein